MMHHSAKDNYVHLTTTPVPRLITSLAVPTIISMLVTSFYNMADTYFVGKINTQSTAAVGIVFSVMSIIQAVGFFFGHGSGNYISRKLGGAGNGECREDGIHRLLFLPCLSERLWLCWDCCSLHRFPLLWGRRLPFFRIRSAIWESFCWVLLL